MKTPEYGEQAFWGLVPDEPNEESEKTRHVVDVLLRKTATDDEHLNRRLLESEMAKKPWCPNCGSSRLTCKQALDRDGVERDWWECGNCGYHERA